MVSGGIDGAIRIWATKWAVSSESAVEMLVDDSTLAKSNKKKNTANKSKQDLNANRSRSEMFLAGEMAGGGHMGAVTALSAVDGSNAACDYPAVKQWTARVVSASVDTTVVVWDLVMRTRKHVLRGHTDR